MIRRNQVGFKHLWFWSPVQLGCIYLIPKPSWKIQNKSGNWKDCLSVRGIQSLIGNSVSLSTEAAKILCTARDELFEIELHDRKDGTTKYDSPLNYKFADCEYRLSGTRPDMPRPELWFGEMVNKFPELGNSDWSGYLRSEHAIERQRNSRSRLPNCATGVSVGNRFGNHYPWRLISSTWWMDF